MKITEYRRVDTSWIPIRQYYWFPQEQDIFDLASGSKEPKPRVACPGCGRSLTRISSRDHMCLGGTEQYPRLNNKHGPRISRRKNLDKDTKTE